MNRVKVVQVVLYMQQSQLIQLAGPMKVKIFPFTEAPPGLILMPNLRKCNALFYPQLQELQGQGLLTCLLCQRDHHIQHFLEIYLMMLRKMIFITSLGMFR